MLMLRCHRLSGRYGCLAYVLKSSTKKSMCYTKSYRVLFLVGLGIGPGRPGYFNRCFTSSSFMTFGLIVTCFASCP